MFKKLILVFLLSFFGKTFSQCNNLEGYIYSGDNQERFNQWYEYNHIKQLNPVARIQYLNSGNYLYSDWCYNSYYEVWYLTVSSTSLNSFNGFKVVMHKFYLDNDQDKYGDSQSYILFYEKNYDSGYINVGSGDFEIGMNLYEEDFNGETYEIRSYQYNQSYWVTKSVDFDCDDNNPSIPSGKQIYYIDNDLDGYGSIGASIVGLKDCPIVGYVTNYSDCNDYSSLVTTQPINWYLDGDGDGYGNPNIFVTSCSKPPPDQNNSKYVNNADDCNDFDFNYNIEQLVWYADFDNDGFGDPNDSIVAPCPPLNYVRDCYFDECPSVTGTSMTGCPLPEYDFDNDNQNYVYERSYLNGFTTENLNTASTTDVTHQINYFDGQGRVNQQNRIGGSPLGNDIIIHHSYNGNGEEVKTYLPYVNQNTNGYFDSTAESNVLNYYNSSEFEYASNPYAEKHIEASPLSRVLEQGAPGQDWILDNQNDTDHTIKYTYGANQMSDFVKHYGVSYEGGFIETPQLVDLGLYAENILYKSITRDENWQPSQQYDNDHTVEEYKDKHGRLVLKRRFDAGKWYDSYNVYDDFGNLIYVLTPKANTYHSITQQSWIGKSYTFEVDEVSSVFASDMDFAELSFYFTPNGNLNIEILGEGEEIEFNDGLVFDLSFLGHVLPDMEIGELEFENGNFAGDLYIDSGNLYIDSANSVDHDYFEASFSIPLSDYQGGFMVAPLDQEQLDDLCYQYRYDNRNRLIEKKIPGKQWEYIVYDKKDRPVLTQDANLRENNKWLFTKYDALGRIIYTGKYTYVPNGVDTNSGRLELQGLIDNHSVIYETKGTSNSNLGIIYSNDAFPNQVSQIELLSVNYYDDYYGINTPEIELPLGTIILGQAITGNTKTLVTGKKVKVLGTNNWIISITYYDEKARTIYQAKKNEQINTIDVIKTEFDFTGKVLQTSSIHTKGTNSPIEVIDNFTYDAQGRLLTQVEIINNGAPELIFNNHYDELGQLSKKNVGGVVTTIPENSQGLQTIDFNYNIRGWLKTINDPYHIAEDLFSFGINYQNPQGPTSSIHYNKPLYDGNISHVLWKTDNVDGGLRHYMYRYDGLNRYKKAYFAINDKINSLYNSYINGYDRNGNIDRVLRYSKNPNNPNYSIGIDNLNYTYKGNQLMEVKDYYGLSTNGVEGFKDGNTIGNDYAYDQNGNMIFDKNKKINNISYNYLNLPTQIDFGNNSQILYTYDASGNKLKKEVHNELNGTITTTTYAGEYIYEKVNSNLEVLKFFNQPEGYVEPNGSSFDYVYQYKDHLDNIRLSYKDMNHDGQITGASTEIFFDDFETASGWDSQGAMYGSSADYDTNIKLAGDYSAKISRSTQGSIYAHSNDWIEINNSEPTDYIYSGWIFLESSGSAWARLLLFMNENNETSYYTEISATPKKYTKGRWIYVEERVTVPANIDKLNMRIDLYCNSSGTARFDNISLRKVNDINAIEIVEENNYYPFGLRHKGYNDVINGTHHPYTFNGKEESEELGLNTLDFGARNYDAALGRWMNIDPLAESMRGQSPYNYAFNNPIYFIDPDGESPNPPTIVSFQLTFSEVDYIYTTVSYLDYDYENERIEDGAEVSSTSVKEEDEGRISGGFMGLVGQESVPTETIKIDIFTRDFNFAITQNDNGYGLTHMSTDSFNNTDYSFATSSPQVTILPDDSSGATGVITVNQQVADDGANFSPSIGFSYRGFSAGVSTTIQTSSNVYNFTFSIPYEISGNNADGLTMNFGDMTVITSKGLENLQIPEGGFFNDLINNFINSKDYRIDVERIETISGWDDEGDFWTYDGT